MAASFNPALTSTTDEVRLEIGDTDTAKPLYQDETIQALLAKPGASVLSVSLHLARGLQARFAKKVDTEADDQRFAYSQAAKAYALLVDDLRSRLRAEEVTAGGGTNTSLGGGIIVSGATAQDVYDSRWDPDLARNARRDWP